MYYLSDYNYQKQEIRRKDNGELIGYVVLVNSFPGEPKWNAFLPGFIFISGVFGNTPEECADNFIEKYHPTLKTK